MPNSAPRIEVLTGPSELGEYAPRGQAELRHPGRLRVFLTVFTVCALLGLAYTFVRPPVYRSTAMLLIVPPAMSQFSDRTAFTQGLSESNVTVHSRSLSSPGLLAQLFERVQALTAIDSLPTLQSMLAVVPVGEADVVELRAEGSEPSILPVLIENWIAVYTEAYKASQARYSDSSSATLSEQLTGLEAKIGLKRDELEAFRAQHDIVSMEREENRAAARLKALNNSLDKALEDQATAEGELVALQESLEQGRSVGLPQEQRRMAQLEQRAVDLREKLNDYAQRFTPEYMAMDPNIQAVKEDLDAVERKMRQYRTETAQSALADAERAVISARQRVSTLRQQLADYKQTAAEFSKRFAEHEALQEELAQLEALHRETAERVVQLEVARADLLPQIKVLEQPYLPSAPVRPHYLRDAAISLGASFVLGLLAIWIYEFLTRSPQTGGRRLWPLVYAISERREVPPAVPHAEREALGSGGVGALGHAPIRELSEAEVTGLLKSADEMGRQAVLMLLSGLNEDEATSVHWQDVDPDANVIHVRGKHSRTVPLTVPLKDQLFSDPQRERPADALLWQPDSGAAGLTPLVTQLARDAGVAYPQEVTAQAVRNTYLAFLARQGIRLSELSRIAGEMDDHDLARYGQLAPPGSGKPMDEIDLLYPVLRREQYGAA